MSATTTPDERILDLERQVAELQKQLAGPEKPDAATLAEYARRDDELRIEKLHRDVISKRYGPVREMKPLFDGVQIERGPTFETRLVTRVNPAWHW